MFNMQFWNVSTRWIAASSFPSVQEINTAERHVCLTRDVQTSLSLSMETTVSKVTRRTCLKKIDVFWHFNLLLRYVSGITVNGENLIGFSSGKNSCGQHQE